MSSPKFRKGGGKPRSAAPVEAEVCVDRVGARGDGIAEWKSGRVFLPLTVPGDRVRAVLGPPTAEGRRGRVVEWIARGQGAAEPPCRHFGCCGGCTLQHLEDGLYADWKRERVAEALERAGVGPVGLPAMARTPPGRRRRAEFAAIRLGGGVLIGFHERMGRRIVELEECPVLDPALAALPALLRPVLERVLPPGGASDLAAARLEDGVDLVLTGPDRLDLAGREALAALADAAGFVRVSWRAGPTMPAEPVAARLPPLARFGGVPVEMPPGAFLQASPDGEVALVAAVLDGVGSAARVADLYAGCGTFSLPLAQGGARSVHAVDGDGPALAALARAGRGMRGFTTEARDLGRLPLDPRELTGFEAVVFDPPRAGAASQAAMLAASAIPVVVAVSCNPATFARDARTLAAGGFRLERALAVDQFLWSAHVELVAVFRR